VPAVAPGVDSAVAELAEIVVVSGVVQTALAARVLSETPVDRRGLGIGNS
jgi:hypothetical protein